MKTYTFKMTRVYETILVVDADNVNDAFNKLQDIDVYQIELEQCCVINEKIELEEESEDVFTTLDKAKKWYLMNDIVTYDLNNELYYITNDSRLMKISNQEVEYKAFLYDLDNESN